MGKAAEALVRKVLATDQLYRRDARPANLQAELAAHRELSALMAADPNLAIQRFLDLALELCPTAGSAGLSELAEKDGEPVFEWTAMAGAYAGFVGGTTPRDFSPCGLCLDRHHTILVQRPARLFPYFNDANPPICEGLIVPLYDTGKKAIGTLWVVTHRPSGKFDPTDARVMEQLAVQLVLAIKLRRKLLMQAALQEAVDDRDLLVDEVRHRVKNMIQMTSSLLRMQEAASGSPEVRQALHEARDRLTVLAKVYDALLKPDPNGRTVNVTELIAGLANALRRATAGDQEIRIELDCDDVSLPVTDATSIGLILNEALTNAFKYAFAGRPAGTVHIRLRRSGSKLSLSISDDGNGFVAPPRAGSLGMRLIRGLARQLDAQVTIDGTDGTTVALEWAAAGGQPLTDAPLEPNFA